VVESPYAALGHTGGAAHQQAAVANAQAQAQGDWRDDGAYCQQMAETAASFSPSPSPPPLLPVLPFGNSDATVVSLLVAARKVVSFSEL
jgi:hypothetical protein